VVIQGRFVKSKARRHRWSDRLAVAAMACASLLAIGAIAFAPHDADAAVAVVYAPWTSSRDALVRAAQAGARVVRFGGLPFIVIVLPERPDYAQRARDGGALLMLDPQALAACLPGETRS
jgi:hypothetical protein